MGFSFRLTVWAITINRNPKTNSTMTCSKKNSVVTRFTQ